MRYIKTLANSFVLVESNGSKIVKELGFKKGGLTYRIENNNIKFYLSDDYFYKNLVWSSDVPLIVDGVSYDALTLPDALKKIFENKGSGGTEITVDLILDTGSTNPIANAPVATKFNEIEDIIRQQGEALLNRYTKTEVDNLLDNFYSKMQTNSMFANYSRVDNETLILNNENITII